MLRPSRSTVWVATVPIELELVFRGAAVDHATPAAARWLDAALPGLGGVAATAGILPGERLSGLRRWLGHALLCPLLELANRDRDPAGGGEVLLPAEQVEVYGLPPLTVPGLRLVARRDGGWLLALAEDPDLR